jgi:hypothetical protein
MYFINKGSAGILPATFIQIKWVTAYQNYLAFNFKWLHNLANFYAITIKFLLFIQKFTPGVYNANKKAD